MPEREKVAPTPQHTYVHPDNWQAFEIFQKLRTQWRLLPTMAGVVYQGLDYVAALAFISADVKKRSRRSELFDQLRLLEAGALSVINGKDISDNATDSG